MKSDRDPRTGSRRWAIGLLATLVVGFFPAPALASDGVIEINQAKVIKAGGFPYVISKAGSYRLTSNLDVTVAADPKNTDAIDVTADNVTLDLNGFSILGPTVCTNDSSHNWVVSCTNTPGNGTGVYSNGKSTAVRNGAVRGMSNAGVSLFYGTVERVRAESNGGNGIDVSEGLVVNCVAAGNGGIGINVAGLIMGSIARENLGDGVSSLLGTVTGNAVHDNAGEGIRLNNEGVVSNNTIGSNGSWGLDIFHDAGYVGNVLTGNNGGGAQVTGGGKQIGQNLCKGALCP